MRSLWVVSLICMIISGCAKKGLDTTSVSKKNTSPSTMHKKTSFDQADIERQEAALLDIAIPPYQQRLPLFAEDQFSGHVVLGYHSDCTTEDQRTFFHQQMERYGWNLRREFKGPELLLEFEKPTRSCAVSIRPHAKASFFDKAIGTDIVIYVEDNSIVY